MTMEERFPCRRHGPYGGAVGSRSGQGLGLGRARGYDAIVVGCGGASWQQLPSTEVVPATAGFVVLAVVVPVVVNAHLLRQCSSPLSGGRSSQWLSSSPSLSNKARASSWSRCWAEVKALLGGGRLSMLTPTGTIFLL
jgi:hypothetical protein